MLEHYNDLIGQCRTINDVNRVHIAFGNTITPQEALLLHRTLFIDGLHSPPASHPDRMFGDAELKASARDWVDRLREAHDLIRKPIVEPFMRRDIRKSVTLYTDGGVPEEKTLLLTLPGANHRLMMPIASFLQNLPARSTDVVLIRDGTRSEFRGGLHGISDSLEGLAAGLPDLLGMSRYRRRSGLGVSAGGLPILIIGLQLGFDSVLASGAGSPFHPKWQRPGFPTVAERLRAGSVDGRLKHVVVIHGAQSQRDGESARDIASCIDAKVLPISYPGIDVQHNALYPMSIHGDRAAFLVRQLRLND